MPMRDLSLYVSPRKVLSLFKATPPYGNPFTGLCGHYREPESYTTRGSGGGCRGVPPPIPYMGPTRAAEKSMSNDFSGKEWVQSKTIFWRPSDPAAGPSGQFRPWHQLYHVAFHLAGSCIACGRFVPSWGQYRLLWRFRHQSSG